ncbi:MAG: cytochrome P450 [Gammaproteobacteria bacterium]|nr:cytochrome P450 [Gammaproteobacteria bacterium]
MGLFEFTGVWPAARVCSIGSLPVNVILRLHWQGPTDLSVFMTAASLAFRRPPGPADAVPLGIDPQTLKTLEALDAEYGSIVSIEQPSGRLAYFVNDAHEVRQLLLKQHAKYRKGPGFERVKMLLGNGLIVSDGDIWRRSRRMIQPAFSRQKVHQLLGVMQRCADRLARRWAEAASSGTTINITEETSEFSLDLILISIFGSDANAWIETPGENPFSFLSRDSTRDLSVVMKVRALREMLLDLIAARRDRQEACEFDFLSMYLLAKDKDGVAFSDAELLDELMTLVVAGFETSANTLNWAWYLLAGRVDVESRLLNEFAEQLPDASDIAQDNLTAMTYTQQVLEETLRLYPPVWLFTRRAEEADVLGDFDVPPGTDIYLSPYLLHRSSRYYEDPDRFDPNRFEAALQPKKDRPYFPFSLGPRRCLGEYFSFLEMKIHLGILLPRFRLERVSDDKPELELGINLRTARDIMLRPTQRD